MAAKTRLAVVVDTFPRWSERFIARELSELVRRGVDLTIFALKLGELPDKNDPDWAGLLDRVIVLPYCLVPSFSLRKDRGIASRLDEIRARLDASNFSRLNCLPSLIQALRDGRYTRIHAHFAGLPSTLAWLAAETLSLPLTISVHARDVFLEAQFLAEKIAASERVYCCHEKSCQHLKTLTDQTSKIVLMRHGLPLHRYPFMWRPCENLQRPVRLICAGRFVEKKGCLDLLAALPDSKSQSQTSGYSLLFCGEGPEQIKLEKEIRRRKLQKIVTIRPPASGQELLELYRQADLFVAPYREASDGDVDGVPNALLEAFAVGLPVAGTQAGGLSELLPGRAWCLAADVPELVSVLPLKGENFTATSDSTWAARRLIEEEYELSCVIDPLFCQIQA